MTANIALPRVPFYEQVANNLCYFIELCDQLDDTRLDTAEREKQNIWQAITFGLQFDATADLSAQLITKLLPLIERKGYAADWIEPVERAIDKVTAPHLKLELTHLLGILCRLIGAFEKSIRLHQHVLHQTDVTVHEQRELHILCHQQLCNVYWAHQHYAEAKQYGEQALALLAQYHAPRVNKGWILNSLGLIAHATGDYEAAVAWFVQTIAVQAEKKNDVLLAINWMNYGQALSQLKRCDEAITAYDQSLDLFDGTAATRDRSAVQINYGDTLAQMGRYGAAEHVLRTIDLDHLRQINDYWLQTLVVHNLASVLLSQKKYDEASLYLDEAYTISQSNNYTVIIGSVWEMRGEIAYNSDDIEGTKRCFERANSVFATVDNDWAKQARANVVERLYQLKDVEPS